MISKNSSSNLKSTLAIMQYQFNILPVTCMWQCGQVATLFFIFSTHKNYKLQSLPTQQQKAINPPASPLPAASSWAPWRTTPTSWGAKFLPKPIWGTSRAWPRAPRGLSAWLTARSSMRPRLTRTARCATSSPWRRWPSEGARGGLWCFSAVLFAHGLVRWNVEV